MRIGKVCQVVPRGVVSSVPRNDDEFHFRILVSPEDQIHEDVIHGSGERIIARGSVEGDIEAIAPYF